MRPGCLAGLLLFCWLAAAGGAVAAAPEPGMLLVARDKLPDPRFQQAVVLLVQSNPEGVAGLILNRPSRLPLAEAIPGLPTPQAGPGTLSYGGPVAPRDLMVLVRSPGDPPEPAQKVIGRTYLTGAEQLAAWLDRNRAGTDYRVFTGYAGWAPGQLDREIARGDWQVMVAEENDLFAGDVAGLWTALSARQGAGMP